MTAYSSAPPQNVFLRWTRRLAAATEWLAAVLLGLIIAVNLTAVLARYVFSSPIGWSEEAMRYGIVWAVYLVAGATFRRGEQMAIDLFRHPVFIKIAANVTLVTTLALAGVVVALGFPFLLDTGQVSPSVRIPMWIPYASVVVGYLLIAIQVIAAYFDPPAKDDGEEDL
ncbi:TRAP transporter small permease subunit [Thalassospira sp. MA62]|nr:TRAP transporter small permease subunit [Thalassospira sp. MA62]